MNRLLIFSPKKYDGCSWYRLVQFANYVNHKKLLDAQFIDLNLSEEDLAEVLKKTNVILARLSPAIANLVKLKGRIPLILDMDDGFHDINPLADLYRVYGTKEVQLANGEYLWKDGEGFDIEANKRKIKDNELYIEMVDGVIVTTAKLADYVRKINSKVPVAVVPNAIDYTYFPEVKDINKPEDEIRIVYSGGSSHFADLQMIKDDLTDVLKKYPNVVFYLVGQKFASITKDMPQNQVRYSGWLNSDAHGYRLAAINGDIGLCPLVDSEFNVLKSSVKYYEYTASGMVTLASNIYPYKEDIADGFTGVLFKDNFKEKLIELIEKPEYRKQLVKNAKKSVKENNSIDNIGSLWASYFNALCEE